QDAVYLERRVGNVDRLAGADDASRAVLEDEPIARDLEDEGALPPVREEGAGGRLDAEAMREAHLGEGRESGLADAELSPLQVHEERLPQAEEPLERRLERPRDRHDGVEP